MKKEFMTLSTIAVVFLVLLPGFLAFADKGYYFQMANLVLIFSLLAASLNLITGVAGLLHLGHAAFYGVGAYVSALLASNYGLPFWLTLPLGGVFTAIVAVFVALPTMRLVSIYFAVATLGIGQMIFLVLLNWVPVTGGPNGVLVFGGLDFGAFSVQDPLPTYFVVAVIVLASLWALHKLSHSYYGNALRGLREDDQVTDAMGIDTVRLKIEVFAIASFFAGIAGAIWAHTTGYISPDDFDFEHSILILAMVVVGGLGSMPGVIVGAILLILLPEVLRGIGDFRTMLVGCVMFLSILLLPKGLIGEVPALRMVRRWMNASWHKTQSGKGVGWR